MSTPSPAKMTTPSQTMLSPWRKKPLKRGKNFRRITRLRRRKKVQKISAGSISSGSLVALADTMEPGWKKFLQEELSTDYFGAIEKFVAAEREEMEIYPPHDEVFAAFNFTPIDQVKVVIIGQDPYFNPNQAHGLCFSVRKGVAVPPSLNRIYKVLETDCPGFVKPNNGCLEEWARRGVLMLNASLTVRKGKANSHAECGWQIFTSRVIKLLNDNKDGLIFFLWGRFAQKRARH